jgi:aminoglycoside phosphotransferase (APT) family kinase protein
MLANLRQLGQNGQNNMASLRDRIGFCMAETTTNTSGSKHETLRQALTGWLAANAPEIGALTALEKFSTGQSNPTYRMQTNHGAGDGRFVLRTQPPGTLLKSAHAVDREFRVMRALFRTAVPVPEMIIACEDTDVIGMKFFIMREVIANTVFDPALPDYQPKERERLFFAKIEVLASMALIDPLAIGLEGFGRPDGYLHRQMATWTRQYRASETDNIPAMEFLIERLPAAISDNVPGFCVIHGDFRIDNLLLRDRTEVAALIDWELSTLGPAFIDLSYWCAMLRMNAQWPIGGLGGIDRSSLGIPNEETLVSTFCERTNLDRPRNWDALIAFQCFRFASILQGVLKRHLDGNASADNAASVGSQASDVAALGAEILSAYLARR